jgi:hypothetical protein
MARILGLRESLAVIAGVIAASAALGAMPIGAGAERAPSWQPWYTGPSGTTMDSVAAFSPKDIWAVGEPSSFADYQMNIVRWNGTGWQKITVPGGKGYRSDYVSGSSASDIWVFGYSRTQHAAFRWDGAHWHKIALPPDAPVGHSVVVLSATDAWVVGSPCGSPECTSTLYQWNGSAWRTTEIHAYISGIAAAPRSAVWAVGDATSVAANLYGPIVAYRWNGTRRKWMAVRMPHLKVQLPTVSLGGAHDVWIGFAGHNIGLDYVLHWNGVSWQRMLVGGGGGSIASPEVTADGHGGVWTGNTDPEHYTGGTWVLTSGPVGETQLIKVPGVSDSYVESASVGQYNGPRRAQVLYFGPKP